jgi:hypothetical protein
MKDELQPEELIRELEERLLQPGVRQSVAEVADLLADDFVEFTSSGRILDKQATIKGLQHETPMTIYLTEYQAKRLAPEVMLVTYRAHRAVPAPAQSITSLRCSIWTWINGRWRLVFHQGTPAADSVYR